MRYFTGTCSPIRREEIFLFLFLFFYSARGYLGRVPSIATRVNPANQPTVRYLAPSRPLCIFRRRGADGFPVSNDTSKVGWRLAAEPVSVLPPLCPFEKSWRPPPPPLRCLFSAYYMARYCTYPCTYLSPCRHWAAATTDLLQRTLQASRQIPAPARVASRPVRSSGACLCLAVACLPPLYPAPCTLTGPRCREGFCQHVGCECLFLFYYSHLCTQSCLRGANYIMSSADRRRN